MKRWLRLFMRCSDCGGWCCPVWWYGDEELKHSRECGK